MSKKPISKLSLSYYSLTTQIIIINFFIAIIGLSFVSIFNYFLIRDNINIDNKIYQINSQLIKIVKYLENNAIIRVPLYNDESCDRPKDHQIVVDKKCLKNKQLNNEIILSEPQLDPNSAQNYLLNRFLDQPNEIKIKGNPIDPKK